MKPTSPPKEEKLVHIGSRYFSKNTHTERNLNLGVELGKTPSGVHFKTFNGLVVSKERTYKPVNKRLPTFPGEVPPPPNIQDEEINV